MLQARALMQGMPDTVSPADSLRTAVALMNRDGCRHVPVLADGILVGILSDRDVRLATNSPVLADEADLDRAQVLDTLTVRECMTLDPTTVSPEAPAREVADLMRLYKRDAVPVVDGGRLVGIVTTTDFVSYVASLEEAGG